LSNVLGLHPDAISDLEEIRRCAGNSVAADIVVALEELETDPNLQANLLDKGFGTDARGHPTANYGVKTWARLWQGGRDIWRLRCFALERRGPNYRVIYAYLRTQQEFLVLAIVPKDSIDYDDPNDALARRIRAAYDAL